MKVIRDPETVIARSILFDYDITANSKRILRNLREEGYEVTRRSSRLPELQRMYANEEASDA